MSEIVTLAESLIPLIRELRHTTENDRRIAEPIVQAIRKSDLCRMLLDTGAPPTIHTGRVVEGPRDAWRAPKRRCPGSFGITRCRVSGPASWMTRGAHGCSATPVGCSRAPHDRPDRP